MSTQKQVAQEGVLFRLGWVLATVACVFPIFQLEYLPIQDLPQHLAAIRVLHDFHDPLLGFQRFFELQLLRTQYLTVYFAVHVLSYLLDLELAMRLVIAFVLVSVPRSLHRLLGALGKDGRLALLAFPLAYNAHFLLGFINFIAGIALAFYGLAIAARARTHQQAGARTRGAAIQLALVALACFYTHVVPFALLCVGVGLLALGRDLRAIVPRLLPLVPCAFAAAFWMQTSAAGQATLAAAQGQAQGKRLDYAPFANALHELPLWLTDVLARNEDGLLLLGWCALMVIALLATVATALFGMRSRTSANRAATGQPLACDTPEAELHRSLARRLLLLAPLCAVLYFVTPTSYDWIWPIAQRFPLLAALFAILWIGRMPELVRNVVCVLALACSLAGFHHAGSAFGAFAREEVGDFDRALAAIPNGQRVAGLIFDRGSRHVAFSPFIHFVAYYQARKGGAVMFTFADFPQSPFRFRDDDRPQRVPPRWEWMPERVRARDLAWYDYVLVRGGPGRLAQSSSGFVPTYRGERWSVFQRSR